MKITQAALSLIKRFEGCRLESYKDPVGVWTIGYGITSQAGIGVTVAAGMKISQADADEYLRAAVELFARDVRKLLRREPTAQQFGALVSLAYNIGVGAFARSTCLKRFNSGDIAGAAEAMTWFNKAGGNVMRGLVRRREAEAAMFLSEPMAVPTPRPDAMRENSAGSTTVLASAGQVAAGASTAAGAVAMLDGTAQIVALCIAGAVVLLAIYVMRERLKKWASGVR